MLFKKQIVINKFNIKKLLFKKQKQIVQIKYLKYTSIRKIYIDNNNNMEQIIQKDLSTELMEQLLQKYVEQIRQFNIEIEQSYLKISIFTGELNILHNKINSLLLLKTNDGYESAVNCFDLQVQNNFIEIVQLINVSKNIITKLGVIIYFVKFSFEKVLKNEINNYDLINKFTEIMTYCETTNKNIYNIFNQMMSLVMECVTIRNSLVKNIRTIESPISYNYSNNSVNEVI